jgi:hypothetical protein
MRKRFRRRAAIEPVISHLKHDFRLWRCFLKGFQGDQLNLMLAAASWNFRKWMRLFISFWLRFLCSLSPKTSISRYREAPESFQDRLRIERQGQAAVDKRRSNIVGK